MNKKFSTLLLSGMLLMSTATPVFAEDVQTVNPTPGTAANPATVSVTKDLEFAEGITIPTTDFSFTATAKSETPGAPKATISAIPYSGTDQKGALNQGKFVISKTSKIQFEDFPHAGEYDYTVIETIGSIKGMAYSRKTYTLRVYVANDDKGNLYVQNVTAQDDFTHKKSDKVLFTNTYTKNGGENTTTKESLVIEKQTVGDLADKTKEFEFDVKFVKAATTSPLDRELTGDIGGEEFKLNYGETKRFKLKHGQKLTFARIPAGTRYEVTEVGADDGYTPSVTVVENGVKTTDTKAQNEGDSLRSAAADSNNLIGENENKVTFVNTYKNVPLTGIIAKNAPMILVAGAGVLAMLGYALTKRKFAKK